MKSASTRSRTARSPARSASTRCEKCVTPSQTCKGRPGGRPFRLPRNGRKLWSMKRLIPLAALLLAAATPLFALDDPARTDRTDRNRRIVIVDEVVRMSQAGVSDDAIISYVEKSREPFDVSADDIIAMTDAHVSKDVI